ncbi:MAG: 1-acyl-sn-glycerol-3-phosphate acyltransferase [Mogibacterium sp.]|nr:1-acyl-sn-glycerol-3-phosphate acyltransferase [Mogibacterium sp.]
MNPFTTIPKFIQGYNAARAYNSKWIKFERLRSAKDIAGEREAIRLGQLKFAETIADKLNINIDISGEEHIPTDRPFMLYSNHQSFADIPCLCYAVCRKCQLGFISKSEWSKYQIMRDAVNYTRSVFIDRGNPREAMRAVAKVKELLDMGFNLAIFPEGTRSKCHDMREFKPGAFKFAEKGKVPVLPVTIDGGYKLYEEKGSYQPCTVKIVFHPLVHLEDMDKHQQKEAAVEIEQTIKSALENQ